MENNTAIAQGISEALPRLPNTVNVTIRNAAGELQSSTTTTNSRVSTGASAMVGQMFGTAAQAAAFNYVALSTSTTAVANGDTASSFTSAGEITTNGLARKQATYTYTTAPASLNATATATLTATWTATASGTIGSVGALNAASAGTLGLETLLGSVVSYNNTDTVSLTWTLNQ